MPQGTIARLNHTRGFGFINIPEGEDLFFHRTNVKGAVFSQLQAGDRVDYEIQYTARGARADNVKLQKQTVRVQFNLAVQDMAQSAAFYVKALGFEELAKNPGHVLLHRDAFILGLKTDDLLWHPALKKHPPDNLARGVGIELVLEVSDINHFHAQIQQADVVIQEPLKEQPWGAEDFRIVDPDGYYWRITTKRNLPVQIPESDEQTPTPQASEEKPSQDDAFISHIP